MLTNGGLLRRIRKSSMVPLGPNTAEGARLMEEAANEPDAQPPLADAPDADPLQAVPSELSDGAAAIAGAGDAAADEEEDSAAKDDFAATHARLRASLRGMGLEAALEAVFELHTTCVVRNLVDSSCCLRGD